MVGDTPVNGITRIGWDLAWLQVVTPQTPRQQHGLYWGYTVRLAKGFSRAVKDSPFKGGYDLVVGTSGGAQGQDRSQ